MLELPAVDIPAEVLDLSGKPRHVGRVFFAPPPGEIGALYRAESSLKAGKREMAIVARWVIASLAMVPGAGLLYLGIVDRLNPVDADSAMPLFIAGAAVAFIGWAIAWYSTRFRASCAYVGEQGAIRYLLKGKLENKPRVQFIEFAKAAELRTGQTRHYYNGIYTGTAYSFKWTDAAGKTVLSLSGKHQGKDGTPKQGDPYHFANATEIAWSTFLLNRADAELAEHGSLRFNIDKKKAVIVGPGFIEFHFGGRVDRCEAGDIKSINLSQGQFAIHHRDAKWYSSKGKFAFPYGNMANARLFLLVLERFLPSSTWAQK